MRLVRLHIICQYFIPNVKSWNFCWHPQSNPVAFVAAGLILCFLCLMKNTPELSQGPSLHRSAPDPPTGPRAPVKGHVCAASNKHLQIPIIPVGTGSTFYPSHLWAPWALPKIPHGSPMISLSCWRSLGPAEPLSGLQLQASAVAMGPRWRALLSIHGVHCVRGRLRENQHWDLTGNEGGVAVVGIVSDSSPRK